MNMKMMTKIIEILGTVVIIVGWILIAKLLRKAPPKRKYLWIIVCVVLVAGIVYFAYNSILQIGNLYAQDQRYATVEEMALESFPECEIQDILQIDDNHAVVDIHDGKNGVWRQGFVIKDEKGWKKSSFNCRLAIISFGSSTGNVDIYQMETGEDLECVIYERGDNFIGEGIHDSNGTIFQQKELSSGKIVEYAFVDIDQNGYTLMAGEEKIVLNEQMLQSDGEIIIYPLLKRKQ